jgi:deoxycytidylate deaminase
MNYPYLPKGRIIEYVSADDEFMKEAMRLRNSESTDVQHPTGAVVVKDGVVIGCGANRSALKNEKLLQFHKDTFCVRRFLKIPSGQKYWLCPGCASCKQHAESRAIKDALRKVKNAKGDSTGKSTIQLIAGADLYLYGHWWCCKPCWDNMIAAGIDRVFLVEGATELFTAKR